MKTGSKRGSGSGSGTGAGGGVGVLDAPEAGYASEAARRDRGAAPAGALQRPYSGYAGSGYGAEGADYEEFGGGAAEMPRRARGGGVRIKLRRLPKSLGGRILLGVGTLLVMGAAVAVMAEVRSYILHDPRFVVATSADIQIVGNAHLSRGDVLSVFGDDIERNVFRVPLAERRTDLERLPWVSHATVMRLLPNHIRVLITERTPVAFVRQGTQIGLVDGNGVLLDMPPESAGDPNYSFPVLTGISAGDPLSTRAARMEIYHRFMQELDSTGQHFSQTVSEVDVSSPEDVKALVASGGTDILVHFGEQDFLHRYQEFEQHLPEWKQQYPKLASADMRYEGQIVLEMQKGAGVPPPSGDSAAVAAGTATADSSASASLGLRNDSQKSNSKGNSNDRSRSFPVDSSHSLRVRMTNKKAARPATSKPVKAKPPMAKLATSKAQAKKTSAAGAGTAQPKAFWVKNGAAVVRSRGSGSGAGGGTTP